MTEKTWTREAIEVSLAMIDDIECVHYDDGSYFDWSIVENDGRRVLEVSDADGNSAHPMLSVSDMLRLYRALGRTLMEDLEA